MAHMQFDAGIDDLVRLDGPMQKGPVPRWQRKSKTVLSVSPAGLSSPKSVHRKISASKTPVRNTTPRRRAMLRSLGKTPTGTGKSPAVSGKNSGKTSNKTSPKRSTSSSGSSQPIFAGDRFIPNRSGMNLDRSNHLLLTCNDEEDQEDEENSAASDGPNQLTQEKYKSAMKDRLNVPQPTESKILSFKQRAPKAEEGHFNNLKVLYSASKSNPAKGSGNRHIPAQADRIMDAPGLRDDFYLTLLDWGPTNHVVVALDNEVYLWNATNNSIENLLATDNDTYVSCVSWIQEGCVLAVGKSDGYIQLWDIEQNKCLRHMAGHASRVGSLAWNQYMISSGSRTGKIHQHDVRIANHHTATLTNHTQEVCGLKWSPDGKYLASGGNDNVVNIWDNAALGQPLFNITQHQSAVKALGWCPWQRNVLASGGGTADRTIHFWNASTGVNLHSVDTGSQVSNILWSEEHKELISSHGYSQYQLTVWKYPTMAKVIHLRGHTNRVLSMCMSPNKTSVMSCAADESLRLWKCFMPDKKQKKTISKKAKSESISSSLSSMQIR